MPKDEIKNRIIEGMKKAGLRLTSQRLAIIDFLAGTSSHPSAAAVLAAAKKKAPTVSLSTVYLTLDALKRAGLIRELEFTDRDSRFEGDVSDHLNLVCVECGVIEDFPSGPPVPADKVEKRTGFKVSEVRLEYYGHCLRCLSRNYSY
jgi:Fur family transcriptional regulator, peroxide stress response regulator